MKKCIRFILCFIFVFLINFNANAEILPEGEKGYYCRAGYYPCFYDAEFNFLIGRDEVAVSDDYMIDLNKVMNKANAPASVSFGGSYVSCDNEKKINFSCVLSLSESSITRLCFQVESSTVYVLERQANNSYKATTNIPVDLNSFACTRNKLFKVVKSDNHFNTNLDFTNADNVEGLFDYSVLVTLYGYKVFENEVYLNKDLYFVVDSCNPLSEEEIIDSLDVNDVTCGKISASNISIIDSNYNVSNNYILPGTYDLKIKAWDINGNITYQKCKIISADVTAPVITSVNVKDARANVLLSENEIISCFTAYDEYSNVTITIEDDNYSDNYQTVGSYNVSAIAVDEAGNIARGNVTINVVDSTAPTITYTDKYITTDSPISMADLRSFITIYDDVDGIITDYSINDEDGYFDHPNIQGEYEFEIEVEDNNNNYACYYISLYVVDKAGPTIEAPTYTIMLNKGEIVTREQILQILKATGQINSIENTTLYSVYFDSLNPEGEYDLEIKTDGEIIHNTIKFVDKNNSAKENLADDEFYAIPVKGDNLNNTYYIVAGISASIIVILAILGIVIYKKKH